MPKLKTNSSAKKRFKKTGTGKFKFRRANRNHILTKKSTKRKRHLRAMTVGDSADQKAIVKMLAK